MDSNDKPAFAKLLLALASTFRQEIVEDAAEGYWLGLNDLDLGAVTQGVKACLRECRFMPAPAEIRERSGPANVERRALEAWERVLASQAMGFMGPPYHRPFGVKDPLDEDPEALRALKNVGGRSALFDADHKTAQFMRRDFLKAYAIMAGRGDQAAVEAGRGQPRRIGDLVGELADQLSAKTVLH